MIAMRYGAVPVARRTGGLADTVIDAGDPGGTGLMFDELKPEALADALERALAVYSDPPRWRDLQLRGMQTDFSWGRSARSYSELYELAKANHPVPE
jgi:starch synthase